MPNDCLIYALGHLENGECVLAVGISDTGINAMENGLTLNIEIPAGGRRIAKVTLFSEVTIADLVQKLRDTGIPVVSEEVQ